MLKNLVQIKKIIALVLTAVFSYLSVTNKIDAKDFMTVFLIIIGFYYGQSTARQTAKETKK